MEIAKSEQQVALQQQVIELQEEIKSKLPSNYSFEIPKILGP
jgi:hypothetical protein